MSSYQVDADLLFSDSDGDAVSSPEPAPHAKRPRVDPVPPQPLRFPSFSSNAASLPSQSRPPAPLPSFASSGFRAPPLRPASHYPVINAPPPHAAGPPPLRRPRRMPEPLKPFHPSAMRGAAPPGAGALGPMGRGRGATLPAHMTGVRAVAKPAAAVAAQAGGKDEDEAASIIPEHLRERYRKEEEKRKALQVAPERKRPMRRRRSAQGDGAAGRVAAAGVGAPKGRPAFGLQSLLAVAQSSQSLIQLDPDRNRGKKARRNEAGNVYKAVSMTKEAVEREDRRRREEYRKETEEQKRLETYFREQRVRERTERESVAEKWRMEKTVAAGMRDAHLMARVEKHLLEEEEEGERERGTLEYLGLRLIEVVDDEATTKLLTVEVQHF